MEDCDEEDVEVADEEGSKELVDGDTPERPGTGTAGECTGTSRLKGEAASRDARACGCAKVRTASVGLDDSSSYITRAY